MLTLRCTAALLKRVGPAQPDTRPSGVLGDWYAKMLMTRPRQLVLCLNERTLLAVVVPLAPAVHLRERFAEAARHRINQIPVSAEQRLAEIGALTDVRIGRTANRSVISSLNQAEFEAQCHFEDHPGTDLEELGLWLSDTPRSALTTDWPWSEAELLLAGGPLLHRKTARTPG